VLKETVFKTDHQNDKPFYEIRERQEIMNISHVRELLMGLTAAITSTSKLIQEVATKHLQPQNIKAIGNFLNRRFTYIWQSSPIEIEKCVFPHSDGYFCLFERSDGFIPKFLDLLQVHEIHYAVNLQSKTDLFFHDILSQKNDVAEDLLSLLTSPKTGPHDIVPLIAPTEPGVASRNGFLDALTLPNSEDLGHAGLSAALKSPVMALAEMRRMYSSIRDEVIFFAMVLFYVLSQLVFALFSFFTVFVELIFSILKL
jgi:hypothetical protein